MTRLFLSTFTLAILLTATGCPESPTGGGNNSGGTNANRADTFTLDKVLTPTTVKQGGADEVTIKLNRDRDFKRSVKLTAENVPDKVQVAFNPATIKPNEDAKSVMKITADKDAALGDHTITVKATPDSGNPTSIEVKIKVEKP